MLFRRGIAILLATVIAGLAAHASAFNPKNIELKDPTGDDKGPGKYSYPTKSLYKKGSFDMTSLKIIDKGSTIEIRVGVNAKIGDPWNSKSWGGNGFSLQMVQVYFNTKKGGFRGALPGMNVKFAKGHGWDKMVFISPQPKTKIMAELKAKAKKKMSRVVIPRKTFVRGRELVAIVSKSELGRPNKKWGIQALMQSNEGYPDKKSVLARKVNEYNGPDRFGGGSDYNCDPHVLDMFAGKAKGDSSESAAQYKELGSFTCDASGKGKKAVINMVYPGK
jgi:carbohydrate-binding DOMON domain-containing protein